MGSVADSAHKPQTGIMFANLCLMSFLIAGCLGEYSGYTYSQSTGIPTRQQTQPVSVPENSYNGQSPYYQQNYAAVPIENVRKEFYAFEAPDEEEDELSDEKRFLSAIQRSVRVIFIKAPENKGLERAALGLAQQTVDDRTAIYVLNRQTDLSSLAQRLNTIRDQINHKPEVHFVKYKTPEEAAHAQRYIQAQYDTLQGRSQVSNEGSAPVIDFASKQSVQSQPTYDESSTFGVGPTFTSTTSNEAVSSFSGYSTQNAQSSIHKSASSYLTDLNNNQDRISSASQPLPSNPVSRIGARISAGRSFVFPTEPKPRNTYLPPLSRT